LNALLDDVFGVLPDTGEALGNGQNSALVTPNQNFKGVLVSAFGGKNKRRFLAMAPDVPSTRIRRLAWRTSPLFRVQSFC
jgi:hypothetical protein